MLVDVHYDQEVFVNSLVKAAKDMAKLNNEPYSMTVPQTTFKHFKNTLHYQQMFDSPSAWKKRLWNSKHNPINFDTPMFMGLRINVVPDTSDGICYMHSIPHALPKGRVAFSSQFSAKNSINIPFEYSLKEVRKYKIRNNLVSILVKSRAEDYRNIPKNEWCAIETLREMITEAEFRKYITHGFILVKGKKGHIYQIFKNRDHTIVWEKGKVIEEVCVRIKDKKIPPTDNVIAFKILIETSEDEFRKLGNVYNMRMMA